MMATAVTWICLAVCWLFASVSSGSDQNARRPLDQYVRHYEHIYYDKDNVMYHHHRVRRSNSEDKNIKLAFTAFDRKFDLRLYPDEKYIHKDARFYNSDGELSRSNIKSYFYSGHDINNPSVQAMGSLAFGVFDGTVRDGNEVYYIEPSNRYLDSPEAESHSIIYRHSDVDTSKVFKGHPQATTCGATTRQQQRSLAQTKQSVNDEIFHEKSRLQKRQTPDQSLVRCSLNVIADYKFYIGVTDSSSSPAVREAQAAALIRNIIGAGSTSFENQDFDDSGSADGIHFSIFNMTVETEAPPSTSSFANNFIGPEAFLSEHSSGDWSDFCLSYRFTYRDFDRGVLGLAYVAADGSNGGLCEDLTNFASGPKTLNTGIVTLLNFNTRVSTAVSGLTFTHEAGHNFGSEHDPNTDECQPSSSNGGRYVMFDRANDGSSSNNNDFSPCSRRMMSPLIQSRGQNPSSGCFTAADNNCGNDIVDDGEDCDCGLNYDRMTNLCNEDVCCNGSSCRTAMGVECSPSEGNCCYDNCTILEAGEPCRIESECALSQTCNGTVPFCPQSEPRLPINESVISCNNGQNFCVDGECTGSICIPLGLTDCECIEEERQCDVCCMTAADTCQSTITIAETNSTARDLLPNGMGDVLEVGFPCNNFNGYCDFFNRCQLIDTEGALRRITAAFINSETFQTIVNFFMDYWWAPIVIVAVVLIVMFLLVLGCHFLLPRPKHMKKRSERRKSIRQSRRRIRVNQVPYSGYRQDQVPMRDHQY